MNTENIFKCIDNTVCDIRYCCLNCFPTGRNTFGKSSDHVTSRRAEILFEAEDRSKDSENSVNDSASSIADKSEHVGKESLNDCRNTLSNSSSKSFEIISDLRNGFAGHHAKHTERYNNLGNRRREHKSGLTNCKKRLRKNK